MCERFGCVDETSWEFILQNGQFFWGGGRRCGKCLSVSISAGGLGGGHIPHLEIARHSARGGG